MAGLWGFFYQKIFEIRPLYLQILVHIDSAAVKLTAATKS